MESPADFVNIHDNSYKSSKKCRYNPKQLTFYSRAVFVMFTFIWILIVAMNKFYNDTASYVLLLPFAFFLLGFMNADEICDDELENDIFSTSFITIGIVVSIPLLGYFNRDKEGNIKDKKSTHAIFIAMITTLLTYLQIWVDKRYRHVCKVIRSCLETIAITLYIYAIILYFLEI